MAPSSTSTSSTVSASSCSAYWHVSWLVGRDGASGLWVCVVPVAAIVSPGVGEGKVVAGVTWIMGVFGWVELLFSDGSMVIAVWVPGM